MSLYAIADTHLSFSCDKKMDVFRGWSDYTQRLSDNWRSLVSDDDTVVIAGDISWAMKLSELYEDFSFINNLPGQKIIIKGNHDYWWQTKKKLDEYIAQNDFSTIKILFNNSYEVGDYAVCGSRGWFFDDEEEFDKKVILREAGRLKMSIDSARSGGKEPIVFLHYPPIAGGQQCDEILEVLKNENIKRCFFGHLHGYSVHGFEKFTHDGITFDLISADFLNFCPKLIEKNYQKV